MLRVTNLNGFGGAANRPTIPSQQLYTTVGTYSFIVPKGVRTISVCAIGAGSTAVAHDAVSNTGYGGGGGALAYSNDIPVTPYEILTIQVGLRYSSNVVTSHSFVRRNTTSLVYAEGALLDKPGNSANCVGTAYSGGAGGKGGLGAYGTIFPGSTYRGGGGGGGAGGYSGTGGAGGQAEQGFFTADATSGGNGSGGAGGGGGGAYMNYTGSYRGAFPGAGGGGVGIFVIGANGSGSAPQSTGGGGGSSGSTGGQGRNSDGGVGNGTGGAYGGGGGGPHILWDTATSANTFHPPHIGANGAVRIIWGSGRTYPSNSANT